MLIEIFISLRGRIFQRKWFVQKIKKMPAWPQLWRRSFCLSWHKCAIFQVKKSYNFNLFSSRVFHNISQKYHRMDHSQFMCHPGNQMTTKVFEFVLNLLIFGSTLFKFSQTLLFLLFYLFKFVKILIYFFKFNCFIPPTVFTFTYT